MDNEVVKPELESLPVKGRELSDLPCGFNLESARGMTPPFHRPVLLHSWGDAGEEAEGLENKAVGCIVYSVDRLLVVFNGVLEVPDLGGNPVEDAVVQGEVGAEESPRTRHPQVAFLAEGLGTRDDCCLRSADNRPTCRLFRIGDFLPSNTEELETSILY